MNRRKVLLSRLNQSEIPKIPRIKEQRSNGEKRSEGSIVLVHLIVIYWEPALSCAIPPLSFSTVSSIYASTKVGSPLEHHLGRVTGLRIVS